MNNRRLLIAAEFHFVHPVEKEKGRLLLTFLAMFTRWSLWALVLQCRSPELWRLCTVTGRPQPYPHGFAVF